jgi:hypothetical protein
MQILSAREFIAQGTSAAAVLSIAKSNSNPRHAGRIRLVAEEVAALTGVRLQGLPLMKAGNDNARQRRRAA